MNQKLSVTGTGYFHTRKECQKHIDSFRKENSYFYSNLVHKPMCFLPVNL